VLVLPRHPDAPTNENQFAGGVKQVIFFSSSSASRRAEDHELLRAIRDPVRKADILPYAHFCQGEHGDRGPHSLD